MSVIKTRIPVRMYSLSKFLFYSAGQEVFAFCCTSGSVYLILQTQTKTQICTDTHRHIPNNTHTHTHTQAIHWCDLQHIQTGIQLPPCQWPIQPSGCTSLRFSPASVQSIFHHILHIENSVLHKAALIRSSQYDISFTKFLTAVSNGYPCLFDESHPSME